MGNKRNVLLTHYDLDGVGCDIVLSNLFDFEKKRKTGYGHLGKIFVNGDLRFYDSCFVTDISLEKFQLQELIDEYKEKLLYTDHHIVTEKVINGCSNKDKSTILFKDGMSATAILFRHFYPMAGQKMDHLTGLVTFIDSYDIWRHKNYPDKFEVGHKLNVLFWHYKYDYFFDRYRKGFNGFTNDEKLILDKYYDSREESMSKSDETRFGENSVLYLGVERQYINEYSLVYPGYSAYYMLYTGQSGNLNLSIRTDRKDADFGNIAEHALKSFECLMGGGGHKQAAGLNFKPNSSLDDVIEIAEFINNSHEDIINKSEFISNNVPF